jgi:uridine monophosphate synthetase
MRYPAIADGLLDLGCVRFGEFTLKSGVQSPIYIDLRRLIARPALLAEVAAAYTALLRPLTFDLLAALPYAALPIGTVVGLHGNWPLVYPRKEAKSYGTKAVIEGLYQPGQHAVVLDDLITAGGSKLEGIEKLAAAGLTVSDIVVLIDRQSGGVDFMAQYGYHLHSVFTLSELLDYWEARAAVAPDLLAKALAFISSTP